MERLDCVHNETYSPIEATIHVGRYAPVLPLCPGKRVLDIACGEGYGSYLLKAAGARHVEGIDVSAMAVDRARQLFGREGLTYGAADAHRVGELFAEKSFDLVVSIETIEHLEDPVAFLRGLRRVVKDDGIIYLSCPNDLWYYRDGGQNPYHLRQYSFAEFQALATAELGGDVRWYYGTAVFGFLSLAADETVGAVDATLPPYAQPRPLEPMQVVPADPQDSVDPAHASYFVGVWNGGGRTLRSGAVYPMSMDSYLRFHASAQAVIDNQNLIGEVDGLRQEVQRLFAVESAKNEQIQAIELEKAEQLRAAEQEKAEQLWAAEQEKVRLLLLAEQETAKQLGAAEQVRAEQLRAVDEERIEQLHALEQLRVEQLRALEEANAERVQAAEQRVQAAEQQAARLTEEVNRLNKAEQEMQIWRAQATVLRRETDLLQQNTQRDREQAAAEAAVLRGSLATCEALAAQRGATIAEQDGTLAALRQEQEQAAAGATILRDALVACEALVEERGGIIIEQGGALSAQHQRIAVLEQEKARLEQVEREKAHLEQVGERLDQELTRLSRAEQEMRIWRAQAIALRHEADLLQENALRDRDLAATAVRLREALTASESLVDQRWAIICEQGDEIRSLRDAVTAAESLAGQRWTIINDQDAALGQLRSALAASESLIEQRWAIICEQGDEIHRLREALTATEKVVEERWGIITAQGNTITAQGNTITRLRRPLRGLRRLVPNFLKPVLRGPARWLRRRVFG